MSKVATYQESHDREPPAAMTNRSSTHTPERTRTTSSRRRRGEVDLHVEVEVVGQRHDATAAFGVLLHVVERGVRGFDQRVDRARTWTRDAGTHAGTDMHGVIADGHRLAGRGGESQREILEL